MKFIHEGCIITIQPDRDVVTSSKPMLHISHSKDDIHLIEFTFDEVQVVSLEDDSKDLVPMSFDQYSSTLVLSMMRGMSYMPGLGLGRRQQGPREFTFTVDHDIPYGLGYTPTDDEAHHMTRLLRDKGMARLSGVPFDYPLSPYHAPRTRGTDHDLEKNGIQGI